jgi:glutathione synthase/RimK-type ligase-like ATP-grasp enzyme
MAHILFVTCEHWPQLLQSDSLVAQALVDRGHHVEAAPWQGAFARFQSADLILLRSQWDYHHDMAGFTTWLQRLAAAALQVYNPVALVRWNLDKSYLLDLQARGVLIPASVVLQVGANPEAIYQQHGWSSAVIKPLAGAGGHLVERVAYAELGAWAGQVRSQRAAGAWLIQAFMAEIHAQGELSLVFLDGVFSHAVVKQPQAGEFRSNDQYQGHIARVEPASAVIAQAHAVLAGLPVMPLYARVDGVITGTGAFCLIELEVNEPDLYFDYAPEQAARFAETIHAKVAGR